ncbi:hypothetical protein ABZ957_03350 [Streptomyces sp. NPDC046316]|uniref:hypothetical protein n=1 Tax=Streptomyces sp. NPDC046316 TaxID=3154494 RepID=UPI0033D350FE
MTANELLILVTGVNLGILLMVLQHLVGEHLAVRQDLRAAEAVLARARKQEAIRDWRDALTMPGRT